MVIKMALEHLSPSTVQSYRTCGRQVYFNKILGVQNPVHYAMTSYGSAMHKAIEALYKDSLTKSQFIQTFFSTWGDLSKEVTSWKTDSYESLLDEGTKACEEFYDTIYGKYEVGDVEQKFVIDRGEGQLPILCFADAITKDGIIIDYKFGRGFTGTADSRGYACNMATYAWAFQKTFGELPKKIVFIKQKWKKHKDKETGKYVFNHDGFVVDEREIKQKDLDFYKSVYDSVETGIQAGVWLPAPDDSFLCKTCGYRLNGMCDRGVDE